MFEKIIEFSAPEVYYNLKQNHPTPIKINIPEWYKKLEHKINYRTVKGCMPFLDTLTFGYSLYLPVDFKIEHNKTVTDEQGKDRKDSFSATPLMRGGADLEINMNFSGKPEVHSPFQLEGSPLVDKNKNLPFYKILNPWIIKTPPGYSCLFVPPLNNTDDRFSIIPGIVDTDTFDREINFPIVLNGDKYPNLDTTIVKGTPYAQVIPFKRDNWKMNVTKSKIKNKLLHNLLYPLRFIHNYRSDFWSKKQCK